MANIEQGPDKGPDRQPQQQDVAVNQEHSAEAAMDLRGLTGPSVDAGMNIDENAVAASGSIDTDSIMINRDVGRTKPKATGGIMDQLDPEHQNVKTTRDLTNIEEILYDHFVENFAQMTPDQRAEFLRNFKKETGKDFAEVLEERLKDPEEKAKIEKVLESSGISLDINPEKLYEMLSSLSAEGRAKLLEQFKMSDPFHRDLRDIIKEHPLITEEERKMILDLLGEEVTIDDILKALGQEPQKPGVLPTQGGGIPINWPEPVPDPGIHPIDPRHPSLDPSVLLISQPHNPFGSGNPAQDPFFQGQVNPRLGAHRQPDLSALLKNIHSVKVLENEEE